jgi:hypothetical protein
MSLNPHGVRNDISNVDALKRVQLRQATNVERLLSASIQSNYILDKDQYEVATRLFSPCQISIGEDAKLVSHPVAALLNAYANRQCISEGKRFDDEHRSQVIDIGGSPLRTPARTHLCALVNDVRTDSRYTEGAFNQLEVLPESIDTQRVKGAKYDMRTYLNGKHAHCTSGAQNCYYKAKYAYAVNVYDITLRDIAKIFDNHDLLVADFWMFLPVSLMSTFTADEDIYKVRHSADGKSYFSLNDNANIYVHDTATWKSYCETTVIKCRDFAITIEHKQSFGTFTWVRFVRTNIIDGDIGRYFCVQRHVSKLQMPDLGYYVMHGNGAIDYFTKYFECDSEFLTNIISWGIGLKDDQLAFSAVQSYINSVRGDIRYNTANDTIVIMRKVDMGPDDFDRFAFSVFIYICICRLRRTKTVGHALTMIKDRTPDLSSSISRNWQYFKQTFRAMLQTVESKAATPGGKHALAAKRNLKTMEIVHEPNEALAFFFDEFVNKVDHHILDAYIRSPSDVYTQKCVTSDIWRSTIHKRPYYYLPGSIPSFGPATTSAVVSESGHIADLTKTSITNVNCITTVLFNPPGDGRCGPHVLNNAIPNLNEYNGRSYIRTDGNTAHVPAVTGGTWWSDEDMMAVSVANGYTIYVHQVHNGNHLLVATAKPAIPIGYISVTIDSNHWYQTVCSCLSPQKQADACDAKQSVNPPVIGDYAALKLDTAYLYVNCANNVLADAAGQALAFAKLFPGYKDTLSKLPSGNYVDDVRFHTHVISGKTYHLCLAVAINAQGAVKKPYDDIHKRFATIMKEVNFYCGQNKLTVVMPLLGGGIFGNDLCCIKVGIERIKCNMIQSFLSHTQQQLYDKTKPCRHGGYLEITSPVKHACAVNDPVTDNTEYNALPSQYPRNHTGHKLGDIIAYASLYQKEPYAELVDLTMAPGFFFEWYRDNYNNDNSCIVKGTTRYITCCYEGPEAFALHKDITPMYRYKDLAELEFLIKRHKTGKRLVVFDCPTTVEQAAYLHKLTNLTGDHYVYKQDPYKYGADIQASNSSAESNTVSLSFFGNDHTPPKSMEMFVFSRKAPLRRSSNEVCTTSQIVNTIVRDHADRPAPACKCSHDFDAINSRTTFNVNMGDYAYYLQELKESYEYAGRNMPNLDAVKCKTITIETINGVGGCRKTANMLRNTCSTCCRLVAPFRKIKEQVNAQAQPGDTRATTFITYLADVIEGRKPHGVIALDEVYVNAPFYVALLAHYAPDSRIVGLGDSLQIDHRNYGVQSGSYDIDQFRPYITETHRMPKKVTALLGGYIKGITTKSDVEGEIEHVEDPDKIMDDVGTDNVICFVQDTKKKLLVNIDPASAIYKQVCTSNESQGSTFRNIRVLASDLNNIREDQIKYIYVAISRCTHKLVMYGSSSCVEQIYTILQSPLHNALTAFNIIPKPLVVIDKKKTEPAHTEVTTLGKSQTTTQQIDGLLQRIYQPANNHRSNIISYKSGVIPHNAARSAFKTSTHSMASNTITVNGRRVLGANYMQYYNPKNSEQVVQCMLSRYAKEGKRVPTSQLDEYLKGFAKFMKKGWKYEINKKLRQTDLFKYTCDYLRKLQTKFPEDKDLNNIFRHDDSDDVGNTLWLDAIEYAANASQPEMTTTRAKALQMGLFISTKAKNMSLNDVNSSTHKHEEVADVNAGARYALRNATVKLISYIMSNDVTKYRDLETEWTESYHRVISFHLKKQPKEIRQTGFDTKYKAGQGISAWSKMLNAIFSGFCRFYSEASHEQVLPNVQISYGKSDLELSPFFSKYGEKLNSRNHVNLMCDFSEFDSSQEEVGVLASTVILRSIGISDKQLDFYTDLRRQWKMTSIDKNLGTTVFTTLNGRWMQHSGQPFTLDGNTMFNMCAIGMCYDIKGLIFAAFKGDDSLICAEAIDEAMGGSLTHKDICGYKIKAIVCGIGEYIANIITPYGKLCPDGLRRYVRFAGTIYKDEEEFNKAKQSVSDCLDVIYDDVDLHTACKIAEMFYAQFNIDISAGEYRLLLDALKEATQMKWDDLTAADHQLQRIDDRQ